MTDAQINRAFRALFQTVPQIGDLFVIRLMGATPSAVADYIWRRWLDEPAEPTAARIQQEIELITGT